MANITTKLNAEETLINAIIVNVRENKYAETLTKVEGGYVINDNVKLVLTQSGNSETRTSKTLVVGQNEFAGKFVRRLVKAVESKLNPKEKAVRGKATVDISEDEAEKLLAMI